MTVASGFAELNQVNGTSCQIAEAHNLDILTVVFLFMHCNELVLFRILSTAYGYLLLSLPFLDTVSFYVCHVIPSPG